MKNRMEGSVKTRESGLELLRIIAAMMVMLSHLSGQIINSLDDQASILTVRLLLSVTVPAVDIFIIITGYFSWKTDRRTIGKPIGLILMLVLFTLGSYVLQLVIGAATFSWNDLFRYCFPFNYFVTLWVALYLISPYINRVISTFDEKKWNRFIILVLAVFSLYPIIIDCIQEILGITLNGASTISRLGSQNGYNIINFILLYCVGAYIGATEKERKQNASRKACIISIACIVVLFLWSVFGNMFLPAYSNSAMSYHNPVVIILAASFFVLFKNLKFSDKRINRLAKAAFAAFLLHHHLFQFLFIHFHVTLTWYLLVAWMLASAIILYFVSWIVWEVYDICTKWFLRKLDKIEIPY